MLGSHSSWWRGRRHPSGISSSPLRGHVLPIWLTGSVGTTLSTHRPGRAALTLAGQLSFTFWFLSWVTSHPDGRKCPLNAKRKFSKTFLVVSFFLRTLFSSEDRGTGFGENPNYVTSVPGAAQSNMITHLNAINGAKW